MKPIIIHGDGEQSRDFVFIDDVVQAWVTAIDQPASFGQVINIGTGRPCSVNELCDAILQAAGTSRDTYPVEHTHAQPGDMRVAAADIQRAKSLLNWTPQVALEDGIQPTLDWARTVVTTNK